VTVIVNYGVGNVGSIKNMLQKGGHDATISGDVEIIAAAKKIILPGVGAFDHAMERLHSLGMVPVLNRKALKEKVPILGICLGMQLLTRSSEEGKSEGFGWIDATTRKFNFSERADRLRVPHMGWNTVKANGHKVLIESGMEERFYFVHSYHVVCADAADVAGITDYGYAFTSAVQRDNIFGVQFHPEKSLRYGMALLGRFAQV
jgi:imidazole glycerol-phosphate synthase subunit HisH